MLTNKNKIIAKYAKKLKESKNQEKYESPVTIDCIVKYTVVNKLIIVTATYKKGKLITYRGNISTAKKSHI